MNYHLFNSRIATHVLFWSGYYLLFGFVWAQDGGYYESYFLEFILLPIRIMAVYVMIYSIIPRYLERERYLGFGIAYGLLLLVSGFVQNIFTFYYKGFLGSAQQSIFAPDAIFRNIILVNTTVVLISAFKVFQLWLRERRENRLLKGEQKSFILELKADKRTYRVNTSDILYIEGLGNYVTYHVKDKKLISHGSMADAEAALPSSFVRIHKSYIVNKAHIESYNNEDVEIAGVRLAFGRAYKENAALI